MRWLPPTTHFPIPSHQTTKLPRTPSNSSTSPRLIRMIPARYYILTVIRNHVIIPRVCQPKLARIPLPLFSSPLLCVQLSSAPSYRRVFSPLHLPWWRPSFSPAPLSSSPQCRISRTILLLFFFPAFSLCS